jgi:hypothetical protein
MGGYGMSGFYKLDGEMVLHGPNFVLHAAYELRKETKDNHEYPVDGWYWFDTDEEAYVFFNVELPA